MPSGGRMMVVGRGEQPETSAHRLTLNETRGEQNGRERVAPSNDAALHF